MKFNCVPRDVQPASQFACSCARSPSGARPPLLWVSGVLIRGSASAMDVQVSVVQRLAVITVQVSNRDRQTCSNRDHGRMQLRIGRIYRQRGSNADSCSVPFCGLTCIRKKQNGRDALSCVEPPLPVQPIRRSKRASIDHQDVRRQLSYLSFEGSTSCGGKPYNLPSGMKVFESIPLFVVRETGQGTGRRKREG